MLSKEVRTYISAAKGLPFFYVIGNKDYTDTLNELKETGLSVIRVSDFCYKDDRYPSIDDLIDYFRTGDVDYKDNKFVVVGLGEYLGLRGVKECNEELNRLKDTTLGTARVVLLLRGITAQAKAVIDSDKRRFIEQSRAFIADDTSTDFSVTKVDAKVNYEAAKGVKQLLRSFEDGASGMCFVNSAIMFDQSLFPVSEISGAHSALQFLDKNFIFDESLGNEEQWARLLTEFRKRNNNLTSVFDKYDFDDSEPHSFYELVSGIEYRNWLYLLYLKYNANKFSNTYLRYVANKTRSIDDLKNNTLNSIIDFVHTSPNFERYYRERKRLVKDFPESDIAIFIKANEIDPQESIFRLTDNTMIERKAIITWVAKYGIADSIENIYPALYAYLKSYQFTCANYAKELTDYFDAYKRQKVSNKIDNDFMELVIKHAEDYLYTKFPTRDSAVNEIQDKDHAKLYWIDALGVEYLSFIASLAKRKGLSMHVAVTRADLPTITSINNRFFNEWQGKSKYKEEHLDEIKHKEKGGYYFTENESPIHLAEELQVISDAVDIAATELAQHKYSSFIIASDHGASRLAVIKKQEEKYETDTRGEHSGRCCKFFDGCDLQHVVEENGFLVLSDYGRFKYSRAANVEVHGGATLEEIIVPVITLALSTKNEAATIQVIRPDDIVADKVSGATLSIYISEVDHPDNVYLMMNGNRYNAEQDDATHFVFILDDVKRSRSCEAELFDGDELLGQISFKVKGKSGTSNSAFDDLF